MSALLMVVVYWAIILLFLFAVIRFFRSTRDRVMEHLERGNAQRGRIIELLETIERRGRD